MAITNVQALLDETSPSASMFVGRHGQRILSSTKSDFFEKYHTLEELVAWMKDLEKQHSELVTPVNIGKSYEGRDITGIRISTLPRDGDDGYGGQTKKQKKEVCDGIGYSARLCNIHYNPSTFTLHLLFSLSSMVEFMLANGFHRQRLPTWLMKSLRTCCC